MKNETKTFIGPFSNQIRKYLDEKVILGNKIESYIYPLKSFDTFSKKNYDNLTFLNKEVIEKWLEDQPNEKRSTTISKASVIRNFSEYMNLNDEKSYILPKNIYNKSPQYIAYIYSGEELNLFFNELNTKIKKRPNSYSAHSIRVIFSLLYMCGMRVSETLHIKVKDFDEKQKIITIYNGKNEKDRIIPLNEYLTNLILDFMNKFKKYLNLDAFLFENKKGKPFSRFTMNYHFWKILDRCNIKHDENGPRIHDFRHSFAIHCLKKWSQEGKDLNVYLPILQTYLGHSNFKHTAYYLKLTADVYPMIITQIEKQCENIIPEIGGDLQHE